MGDSLSESRHQATDAFPTPQNPEQVRLDTIRGTILAHLADRRQDELDEAFHADPNFAHDQPEAAAELKSAFLTEKQGLTIQQCFALSLEPAYFGRINVVKLASTDHSTPDASFKMFQQMNDFLEWLKTTGPLAQLSSEQSGASDYVGDDEVRDTFGTLVAGEDPGNNNDRFRSGRWMEYDYVGQPENGPSGYRAVITRVRPFVIARAPINGVECDVHVFKETVFTIPAAILKELVMLDRGAHAPDHHHYPAHSAGPDGKISERAMLVLERMLYTSDGDSYRQRIHTAIYSSVEPASDDVY